MTHLGAHLPVEGLSQCLAGAGGEPAVGPPAFSGEEGAGRAGSPHRGSLTYPHAFLSPDERWLEPAALPPVERGLEKPLPNYLLKAASPAQMV